jgi:hypothetical protein
MRGHDDPERPPDATDLLDRDRIREGVQPRAAILFGDRDPQPAHLAEPAHDLARETMFALVFLDGRCHFGCHELADRLLEKTVLGRQVEVHGVSLDTDDRGRPAEARSRC